MLRLGAALGAAQPRKGREAKCGRVCHRRPQAMDALFGECSEGRRKSCHTASASDVRAAFRVPSRPLHDERCIARPVTVS